MAALNGYYSLIQYCPDRARLEAANIGVLLICPAVGFADVKLSENNSRVNRFFSPSTIDVDALEAAKRAIRNRVNNSRKRFLMDADAAEAFIGSRGNDIQLSPSRPVKVDAPQEALESLFRELVGGRRMRENAAATVAEPFRALDYAFRQPSLEGKIRFNLPVTVPVVGLEIVAPYAFKNGALNLIKPHRFRGRSMVQEAMPLAVEGDLLYRHTMNLNDPARLVLVTDFPGSSTGGREKVKSLLAEYHVRSFDVSQISTLVEEISRTAHA